MDIRIAVLPTTKCHTGCSHCNFKSTAKGEDLALTEIEKLKKTIKKHPGQVEVVFTGGGEPLEWPHLPAAISSLQKLPNVSFGVVTSGCLNEKDDRFRILKEVLDIEPEIYFSHSFNLFSPTFPQRLEFTLPYLLKRSNSYATDIKMLCGIKEEGTELNLLMDDVVYIFEKALTRAVGKCGKILGFPGVEDKEVLTRVVKGQCGQKSFWPWLEYLTFISKTVYIPRDLHFLRKRVIAYKEFVTLQGRFEEYSCPGTAEYNYQLGFFCSGWYRDTLDLWPDGRFLFCAHHPEFPFHVGVAGNNLKTLFKRKLAIKGKLNFERQFIEETSNLYDPCENCLQKAWRMHYQLK